MTPEIITHYCNTEASKYGTKVWEKGQPWNFNSELTANGMKMLAEMLERNKKFIDNGSFSVSHFIKCANNNQ